MMRETRRYVKRAPMWQMVDGRWVTQEDLEVLEARRVAEERAKRADDARQLALFSLPVPAQGGAR